MFNEEYYKNNEGIFFHLNHHTEPYEKLVNEYHVKIDEYTFSILKEVFGSNPKQDNLKAFFEIDVI